MSVETFPVILARFAGVPAELGLDGALGVIVGVVWFWFVQRSVSTSVVRWSLHLGLLLVAIWVITLAEAASGSSDPTAIVLDECVAAPFIFLFLSDVLRRYQWRVYLAGIVLFGLFDSVKPFGIVRLEQLPGGVGVVADDLAAALLAGVTCFLFTVVARTCTLKRVAESRDTSQ